ncbi:unnamed protein product [Ceratitis capitata]|uniref:(Mediterranean fruit fly) hypothetical protein n=1 Tax=Ceratitis capitata TaxID=7213 RepID=A0A811U903_CERCA|nr:unnamed protein product [Ceratitis capitata]
MSLTAPTAVKAKATTFSRRGVKTEEGKQHVSQQASQPASQPVSPASLQARQGGSHKEVVNSTGKEFRYIFALQKFLRFCSDNRYSRRRRCQLSHTYTYTQVHFE